MSGMGGPPLVSMTVTCVIATVEAAAADAPANAAASAPHSTSPLMSYSSRSQIDGGRRFQDNGVHDRTKEFCQIAGALGFVLAWRGELQMTRGLHEQGNRLFLD
jgi:hypothetical protein